MLPPPMKPMRAEPRASVASLRGVVRTAASSLQLRCSSLGGAAAHGQRSPKIARPTRTIVAPSSIATSKSSLMPIDSSRRPAASRRARSRRKYGRAPPAGPAAGSSSGLRPTRCGSRRRASSAGSAVGRDAALARLAADVHLDSTRARAAACRGMARQRLAERDAVDRVDDVEDLERARRLVALQVADQMPARRSRPRRRASPPPPARSSRRCRARRRRRAARTSAAGLVFATAISRTPSADRGRRARRPRRCAPRTAATLRGDVDARLTSPRAARRAPPAARPRRSNSSRTSSTGRPTTLVYDPVDARDERRGAALDGVRAGLVERLAGGDVGVDLRRRSSGAELDRACAPAISPASDRRPARSAPRRSSPRARGRTGAAACARASAASAGLPSTSPSTPRSCRPTAPTRRRLRRAPPRPSRARRAARSRAAASPRGRHLGRRRWRAR